MPKAKKTAAVGKDEKKNVPVKETAPKTEKIEATGNKEEKKEDVTMQTNAKKVAEKTVKEAGEVVKSVAKSAEKTAKKAAGEMEKTAKTVKEAVKKAAAKTEKNDAEVKVVLQYSGHDIDMQTIAEEAKAAWVAKGHRESSIKQLEIYLNIDENRYYTVINKEEQGGAPIHK